jgi:SagB-type dehydrogenase family enzyme
MRLYLVAGAVDGLEPGVYLYEPSNHSLSQVKQGDIRLDLKTAAVNQEPIGNAPASIIIAAIPSITEAKYGDRSMRYIDNEAGCIAQNIYLQCEPLALGTVTIGAFYDDAVARLLGAEVSPRLIMPVGARE